MLDRTCVKPRVPLDGFHAFEPDANWRRIDGDAALPAPLLDAITGACLIKLPLGSTARYPLLYCGGARAAA